MNSMNQICAVVGGVVIVVGLAACDEKKAATPVVVTETAPAAEDAGPIYLKLHGEVDPALVKKLGEFDGSVDGALAGMLTSSSGTIQQAIAASKMTACDFGMRYTMEGGRPGLAPMRAISRLLNADAKRCLAANDVDGAAERAATIFRMSRQLVGGSECTIDVMVACALTQLGTGLLGDLAGKTISTPVKDELRAASQPGRFAKGGEAAANDCRVFADAVRTKPEKFGDWVPELKGLSAQDREAVAAAMEQFAAALPGLWNGPDSEGQIAAAIDKLPPVGKTLTETTTKLRKSVRDAEQKMAMARSQVR